MDRIALITIAVIAAGLVLSWLVGRVNSRRGAEVRLAINLTLALLFVATFIREAERAARHGGWFIVLAVFFALVAVMGVALCLLPTGALWLSLTGRIPEEDDD